MFNFFKKKSNQTGVGGIGENIATTFLQNKGYTILDLNWYNSKGKRLGELDIIAKKDKDTIIFIEVKTRQISNNYKVFPEEQVTRLKIKKIQKVAESYISQKKLWDLNWRFDVVSITFYKTTKEVKINHIKNVFY